jgi:hypothetical protein
MLQGWNRAIAIAEAGLYARAHLFHVWACPGVV